MSTQAVVRAGPTHVPPITRSLNVSCVWSLSLLLRLGLESVCFLPRVGWTVPPEPCVPQAWNLRTCYLAGPKRLCSCDKGPTSGWGGCLGWSRRARSRQPPKEDREGKRVQRGPGGAGGPPTDFWLWSHRAAGSQRGCGLSPKPAGTELCGRPSPGPLYPRFRGPRIIDSCRSASTVGPRAAHYSSDGECTWPRSCCSVLGCQPRSPEPPLWLERGQDGEALKRPSVLGFVPK